MDLYAKIVFTVIAAALSVIALQQIGAIPAQAQAPSATKVVICDNDNANRCVGITTDGKLPVESFPPK